MTHGECVSCGAMGTRMTLKRWMTTEKANTMKREVPLAHPGIILLEDWLKPMGISPCSLEPMPKAG